MTKRAGPDLRENDNKTKEVGGVAGDVEETAQDIQILSVVMIGFLQCS